MTNKEYRPLVYICRKYRGDIKTNVENARKYCRFAINNMTIPIAPHLLYPQFMNDDDPNERYLAVHTINYVLLGKCRELWVFGKEFSDGMQREIDIAKRRKMKIKYFSEEMEEQA